MAAELESMRLKEAAKVVREGFAETLAYCEMPASIGGASARTTPSNGSTGRNREIRRVPASSALSPSALMLVAACLKYVADSEWGSRRYLNASLINE